MSDQQHTYLEIDPTPERNPVLPAGTYGADGEATLKSLRQFDDNGAPNTVRFGRDAGKPCIKMAVSVLTSEYGFITFFDDLLLEGAGNFGKNRTLRILGQLGITPVAGGKTDVSAAEGSKVIVDLAYDEWDAKGPDGQPTGERRSKNKIRNVWLRK